MSSIHPLSVHSLIHFIQSFIDIFVHLESSHLSVHTFIYSSIQSPLVLLFLNALLGHVVCLPVRLSVCLFRWFKWSVCFVWIMLSEALCDQCVVPVWLFKVIFWLGYCNSLMNPVIYACSSREFQRAFLRILRCSRFRRQEPQFLRQTFLALQSVHATSASIATNFNHSSRRLAVGVAHGGSTFIRSNSSPTSPTTDVKNDIPMVRIQWSVTRRKWHSDIIQHF